jgi:hypothetical protein
MRFGSCANALTRRPMDLKNPSLGRTRPSVSMEHSDTVTSAASGTPLVHQT